MEPRREPEVRPGGPGRGKRARVDPLAVLRSPSSSDLPYGFSLGSLELPPGRYFRGDEGIIFSLHLQMFFYFHSTSSYALRVSILLMLLLYLVDYLVLCFILEHYRSRNIAALMGYSL